MTSPDAPALSRRARLTLWLLLSLVVAVGSELALRLLAPPPGFFPINQREDSLYIPDSVRQYTLRPGARHVYATPDLSVLLAVNGDGLRGPSLADARAAGFRVLDVGDSFTFGLAIAEADSWSARLAERLRAARPGTSVSVVNAGIPGYSPRQVRQRLEYLLPLVRPDVVVVGLTVETFNRMQNPIVLYGGTLVRRSVVPHLTITDRGLLFSPFESPGWRSADYWLNRHFLLAAHLLTHAGRVAARLGLASGGPATPVWPVDSAAAAAEMQPTFDELARIREVTAAARVPLIVLLINAQRDDGRFDTEYMPQHLYNRMLVAECRRQGIRVIDLLPELERQAAGRPVFRTEHDQHWTPAAHRIAADSIAATLATLGVAAHGGDP